MNDDDEAKEVSCEENAGGCFALYKFNLEEFLEKLKGDTNE
jgi:hypothetical protein